METKNEVLEEVVTDSETFHKSIDSCKRLSEELSVIITTILKKEELTKKELSDVIPVLEKIADIPLYLQLDAKRLLKDILNISDQSNLFDEILKRLGITRRIANQIKNKFNSVIEKDGINSFLTTKNTSIEIFLYDIIVPIVNALTRTRENKAELDTKVLSLNNELMETKHELKTIKDDYNIRETYVAKDFQLMLQYINNEADHEVLKSKAINLIKDSLEDIEIKILWKIPLDDNGSHFVEQYRDDVGKTQIVRPCLLKKNQIIHPGIVYIPNDHNTSTTNDKNNE